MHYQVSLGLVSLRPLDGNYVPVYAAIADAWERQGFEFQPAGMDDQPWMEYLRDVSRARPPDPERPGHEQRGVLRFKGAIDWTIYFYAEEIGIGQYFEIEASGIG
jgi:hypothetical protein